MSTTPTDCPTAASSRESCCYHLAAVKRSEVLLKERGLAPTFFDFWTPNRLQRAPTAWGAETTEEDQVASGTEELERAVAAACDSVGVELVDIELRAGVLQVTVEREEGIDLECVARASRVISDLLDAREDLAPDTHYELEVSSPGVERRLRRPEQFERAVGTMVSVRTLAGVTGERRAEGVLSGVDDEGFTLVGDDGAARHVRFDDVDRAHTVFDWKAALRAGRSRDADRPDGELAAPTIRHEEARA